MFPYFKCFIQGLPHRTIRLKNYRLVPLLELSKIWADVFVVASDCAFATMLEELFDLGHITS